MQAIELFGIKVDEPTVEKVEQLAKVMCDYLETDLTKSSMQILGTYVPIALWIESQLKEGQSTCIGLRIPQGGGTTTMANVLKATFDHLGKKTALVSLEDLRSNEEIVGAGLPGEHDIQKGLGTLDQLKKEGHDLIIFSGWMLGYQPLPDQEMTEIEEMSKGMTQINENLKAYKVWDDQLDAAILASSPAIKVLFEWTGAKKQGGKTAIKGSKEGIMEESEIMELVTREKPLYNAYSENAEISGLDNSKILPFRLDYQRRPFNWETRNVMLAHRLEATINSKIKLGTLE